MEGWWEWFWKHSVKDLWKVSGVIGTHAWNERKRREKKKKKKKKVSGVGENDSICFMLAGVQGLDCMVPMVFDSRN